MSMTRSCARLTFAFSLPLVLAACGGQEPPAPAESPSINAPVVVVGETTSSGDTMASGTVEANDRVQLVARMAGTVRAPSLYEGQPIRRGEVLATIDARQANAALQGARAALAAAQAEQRDAQGDVTRDAPLAQSGALSGDAYRKEQLRHETAIARVAQARAALASAGVDQAYTSIINPVNGVVVARHIRDGDMALPGTPLVTVEGRGQLLFRFAAPQSGFDAFTPGGSVPVLLDGREDRPITGRVRGVVPSADPATRRYTVEILLPRENGIMPGMFGRVALPSAQGDAGAERAVTVPAAAVVDRGGLDGVFVVGKDRGLTFRWIRLGDRTGDHIVVTSGLAAGEHILARVDPAVRDGARLAHGAAR